MSYPSPMGLAIGGRAEAHSSAVRTGLCGMNASPHADFISDITHATDILAMNRNLPTHHVSRYRLSLRSNTNMIMPTTRAYLHHSSASSVTCSHYFVKSLAHSIRSHRCFSFSLSKHVSRLQDISSNPYRRRSLHNKFCRNGEVARLNSLCDTGESHWRVSCQYTSVYIHPQIREAKIIALHTHQCPVRAQKSNAGRTPFLANHPG